MANQAVIELQRMDNTQPWGFRLKGGVDQGIPLYVEHVQPGGRGAACGLMIGDLVVAICGSVTHNLTHAEVKGEMLRAGNELSLVIRRDGSLTMPTPPSSAPKPSSEGRSVVVEEPLPKLGGPRYKNVVPKTYKVLEESLPTSSSDNPEATGNRPASIFDRKKEDRSEYLKAKGATIQKAYGEQQ